MIKSEWRNEWAQRSSIQWQEERSQNRALRYTIATVVRLCKFTRTFHTEWPVEKIRSKSSKYSAMNSKPLKTSAPTEWYGQWYQKQQINQADKGRWHAVDQLHGYASLLSADGSRVWNSLSTDCRQLDLSYSRQRRFYLGIGTKAPGDSRLPLTALKIFA